MLRTCDKTSHLRNLAALCDIGEFLTQLERYFGEQFSRIALN